MRYSHTVVVFFFFLESNCGCCLLCSPVLKEKRRAISLLLWPPLPLENSTKPKPSGPKKGIFYWGEQGLCPLGTDSLDRVLLASWPNLSRLTASLLLFWGSCAPPPSLVLFLAASTLSGPEPCHFHPFRLPFPLAGFANPKHPRLPSLLTHTPSLSTRRTEMYHVRS